MRKRKSPTGSLDAFSLMASTTVLISFNTRTDRHNDEYKNGNSLMEQHVEAGGCAGSIQYHLVIGSINQFRISGLTFLRHPKEL